MQAASGPERYITSKTRWPSTSHAPLAPLAQINSCSSRSIHQQLVTGQYRARRRQLPKGQSGAQLPLRTRVAYIA